VIVSPTFGVASSTVFVTATSASTAMTIEAPPMSRMPRLVSPTSMAKFRWASSPVAVSTVNHLPSL
jgi:hypothetical protein